MNTLKRNKRISRKPKAKSLSWWKRIADSTFSEYIRKKDAVNGIATCVTCGNKGPWQKLQNGHYVSRSHLSLRYSETNCHVQCIACNMFKHGNMDDYALFLQREYGPDILDLLAKEKQKINKMSIPDYQALIDTYKQKIKDLP